MILRIVYAVIRDNPIKPVESCVSNFPCFNHFPEALILKTEQNAGTGNIKGPDPAWIATILTNVFAEIHIWFKGATPNLGPFDYHPVQIAFHPLFLPEKISFWEYLLVEGPQLRDFVRDSGPSEFNVHAGGPSNLSEVGSSHPREPERWQHYASLRRRSAGVALVTKKSSAPSKLPRRRVFVLGAGVSASCNGTQDPQIPQVLHTCIFFSPDMINLDYPTDLAILLYVLTSEATQLIRVVLQGGDPSFLVVRE
jgi:hypothetical protein